MTLNCSLMIFSYELMIYVLKLNLSYFKVWGCIAYFRVPDPKRTKLEPRAIKSVFIGYTVNSKAYRLLDLSSNTMVESRDVEFIENKFINDSQSSLC